MTLDPAYGESYGRLYREHWWWRAREELVLQRIRAMSLPGTPPLILDVGCGDGLFFDKLSALGVVHGLERDASLVSSNGRWSHAIRVGAFDESFQPHDRYSLILMLDVLEHIQDSVGALARARSLLLEEGRLLITVPAFQALWTTHDELNHHQTRYDAPLLERLATEAGLDVIELKYFFHWLYPVKLVLKAVERVQRPRPRVPRIPPGALNKAALGVCRAEHALFGQHPLPFGASLLALLTPKG